MNYNHIISFYAVHSKMNHIDTRPEESIKFQLEKDWKNRGHVLPEEFHTIFMRPVAWSFINIIFNICISITFHQQSCNIFVPYLKKCDIIPLACTCAQRKLYWNKINKFTNLWPQPNGAVCAHHFSALRQHRHYDQSTISPNLCYLHHEMNKHKQIRRRKITDWNE